MKLFRLLILPGLALFVVSACGSGNDGAGFTDGGAEGGSGSADGGGPHLLDGNGGSEISLGTDGPGKGNDTGTTMTGIQKQSIGCDSLHQVRLQSFFEQPKASTSADVGPERASHARFDVAL